MKILLTGSSGMLGREIYSVFKKEHEIIGVDLVEAEASWDPIMQSFCASIVDFESIKRIFDETRPEAVIHAAAWTDVDGCELDPDNAYRVNTQGTKNIVEIARDKNIPLVFISTDFVFDGEKKQPYKEEDECNPLSVYAKSKREAEEAVIKSAADYRIVRTGWLYGSGGRNFVDAIVKKGRREKRLRVVNDQRGSPTYAKDLAGGLKALIEKTPLKGSGIYHISNSGSCTWFEYAKEIKNITPGMEEVTIDPVTAEEYGLPAPRPAYSVLDNTKFQKATGFNLRPWEEALKEYIQENYE